MHINRKNKQLIFIAMLLCIAFVFVLVSSELLVSGHDCAGEGCVVCALSTRVKGILTLFVCMLFFAITTIEMHCGRVLCLARETLVSRKAKLTI